MSHINPPPQILPPALRAPGLVEFFDPLLRAIYLIFIRVHDINTEGSRISAGSDTPEANVVGKVGDLYLRQDGGANTTLYVKESGTGNTGWVGK